MELFFWIVNLAIPFVMIAFGLVSKLHPPKKINGLYGYRTTRSMKSQATWDYAHQRIGFLWLYIGSGTALIITISMLFVPISLEYLTLIHMGVEMVALFIGIPFVEKELKEKFDEKGNPKAG